LTFSNTVTSWREWKAAIDEAGSKTPSFFGKRFGAGLLPGVFSLSYIVEKPFINFFGDFLSTPELK